MKMKEVEYICKIILTIGVFGLSWKYPLALLLIIPIWFF